MGSIESENDLEKSPIKVVIGRTESHRNEDYVFDFVAGSVFIESIHKYLKRELPVINVYSSLKVNGEVITKKETFTRQDIQAVEDYAYRLAANNTCVPWDRDDPILASASDVLYEALAFLEKEDPDIYEEFFTLN